MPLEIFCSAITVGLIGYSEACGSDYSIYAVGLLYVHSFYKWHKIFIEVNKITTGFFLFLFVLWSELTLLAKIPIRGVFFYALWG